MADRFRNYLELSHYMNEGVDYQVILQTHSNKNLFLAPHGGNIELGTSEIVKFLAGDKFSFYSFEGMKENNIGDLHLTSHNFDEPRVLKLIQKSEFILAIHGYGFKKKTEVIELGGLDRSMRERVKIELQELGFQVIDSTIYPGQHQNNICNRGLTKMGVQLEIPYSLRSKILEQSTEGLELLQLLKNGIYKAYELDI